MPYFINFVLYHVFLPGIYSLIFSEFRDRQLKLNYVTVVFLIERNEIHKNIICVFLWRWQRLFVVLTN